MTPDIPKGPESEARPALWKRLMEATAAVHGLSLATRVYLVDQVFPLVNAHANRILQYGAYGDRDAVEAISAAVSEVERLTAEVERLRALWPLNGFGEDTDVLQLIANHRAWTKSAYAEVSRLREQLAAQRTLPVDAEDQLRVAVADPGSRLPRKAWTLESASEPIHRWSARAVLDLLKSWGVSSSEVEAPQQEDETDALFGCDATWYNTEGCRYFNDGVHRCCVAPLGEPVHDHHCMCGLWLWHGNEPLRDSATSEASQHKVFVGRAENGWWQGTCPTCDIIQLSPRKERVEDWKDQHEADTPRPSVESPNRQANQHDEGRPAGSERLAPRQVPAFSLKEMTQVDWEVAIAEGERDQLLKMAGELLDQCTEWDDEFGACAESVPDPACRIRAIVNRYAWLKNAAQAARSGATPEDTSSQPPRFKVGDEVRWCWSGANADGTWFKARLTEEHPANYPKGWAGEITDRGTAYTAEHMGEVPLGFQIYMDVPSMSPVSEPSPSLPKEGEDSDDR